MIEAVNSVLANASLVRGTTNQIDASRAPDIDTEAPSAPQAPFISPFISIDAGSNTAVIQIRDSETGDVLRQFPSETTIATRQRQEQLSEVQQSNAQQRVQNNTEFTVQEAPNVSVSAPSGGTSGGAASVNIAAAQQASVALSTGAVSGQQAASSVNITA